jgi:hypothetical protein
MKNLVNYLDEALIPLELKVKEYLDIERDIRLLEVELLSLQSIRPDFDPENIDLETALSEGQDTDRLNDKEQKMAEMLERYNQLRQEVVQLLPEKNKYIELNLGYGPSQVGYFTIDHDTHRELSEPILRVVH